MWTEQDRTDAMVWLLEDDDRLPCGHSKSEAMHPDNEDRYEVHRLVCHACRAVHQDRNRLEDSDSAQFMYFVAKLEGGG